MFAQALMAEAGDQKSPKTIYELLGIEPAVFDMPAADGMESAAEAKALPPQNIPVAETEAQVPEAAQEALEAVPTVEEDIGLRDVREYSSPVARFLQHNWVRYPLIFVAALGFFYLVLNFQAISTQVTSLFSRPGQEERIATAAVAPEYGVWIKKYYVHVNDPALLDPKHDADGDGLTNLEEFYLGTNPLLFDTDEDGYGDGLEILNGYNPLYEGLLTPRQQIVIAERIDLEQLAARNNFRRLQDVAGEREPSPNLEPSGGSMPFLPLGRQFVLVDGFRFDVTKPGNLKIPKIGVDAPIVWSHDFSRMEEDLKRGAAHHPATPFPAQRGTASIHGHSSGNLWDGNFKTVLTKLNFLEAGDEVFVTVYAADGTPRRYIFAVRQAQVYAKNDPAQFQQLVGYFLNLSTSWPVGTAHQRYVVTTELIGL